jgi:hypothetical protein
MPAKTMRMRILLLKSNGANGSIVPRIAPYNENRASSKAPSFRRRLNIASANIARSGYKDIVNDRVSKDSGSKNQISCTEKSAAISTITSSEYFHNRCFLYEGLVSALSLENSRSPASMIVPMGQTQPQKNRPNISDRITSRKPAAKILKINCLVVSIVTNATKGSDRRKISCGMDALKGKVVFMNRKTNNDRKNI